MHTTHYIVSEGTTHTEGTAERAFTARGPGHVRVSREIFAVGPGEPTHHPRHEDARACEQGQGQGEHRGLLEVGGPVVVGGQHAQGKDNGRHCLPGKGRTWGTRDGCVGQGLSKEIMLA
jgi:hypothetical protein